MNLVLRERENWLDDFFKPYFGEEEHYNYSLPTDLKEVKDEYIVKTDLPGLEEKDIKVEFDNGILMITGERKNEEKEEKENFFRKEIRYGKFSRSFRFGNDIKVDDIKAKFKNGVLEIKVPKAESKKPKQIPLH